MKEPSYDLRRSTIADVQQLCTKYHGYASAGGLATYAFAVYEKRSREEKVVAVFAWQPPPYGAAKSACPEAPYGVLSLSRMTAVPRRYRSLRHISAPLRRQMRMLIDRTRWPVLITYHDEGQGHTGHVYKCSGWQPTTRSEVPFYMDNGARVSCYSNGLMVPRGNRKGTTFIQRWEHRVCPVGEADKWMKDAGWRRKPVPGKVWKSGNQAFRMEKT